MTKAHPSGRELTTFPKSTPVAPAARPTRAVPRVIETGSKTPDRPSHDKIVKPKPRKNKYPAEGVTLEMMVTKLSENYGWDRLGEKVKIRCFTHDPSINSSLHFLRRTPWAREKVEQLYRWRAATGWDPRDNAK